MLVLSSHQLLLTIIITEHLTDCSYPYITETSENESLTLNCEELRVQTTPTRKLVRVCVDMQLAYTATA